MARGGVRPLISCPECARKVRVARGVERIYAHKQPSGEPCPGGGQHVDIYGVGEGTR